MPRSQFLLELVGPMCSQAEGDLVSLEEEEREKGRKEEGEGGEGRLRNNEISFFPGCYCVHWDGLFFAAVN